MLALPSLPTCTACRSHDRTQSQSLYARADRLGEEERKAERKAVFGCFHGALTHVLYADRLWRRHFAGVDWPQGSLIARSAFLRGDWEDLKGQRATLDRAVLRLGRQARVRLVGGDLVLERGQA